MLLLYYLLDTILILLTTDTDITPDIWILTTEHVLITKRYHNSWYMTLYWFQIWYHNSWTDLNTRFTDIVFTRTILNIVTVLLNNGQEYIDTTVAGYWYCSPVNQYREVQLEIILKILNKDTTYTEMGETDGFQFVYVLIVVCTTPILDSPEAKRTGWGILAPLSWFMFLFNSTQVRPSA